MKTTYKIIISICIGLCFIFAGIAMGGLQEVSFTRFIDFDFRFNAHRIDNIDYQTSALITELEMDIFNANIEFLESSDEQVRVVAQTIYDGFEVYQDGNSLVIDQDHYLQWFQKYERSDIKIYLPKDYLIEDTELKVNAGNVKVSQLKGQDIVVKVGAGNLNLDGVKSKSLDIDVGMGNANADDVTIEDQLKVNVGMGNANIDINGKEYEYSYIMKAGLGTARVGSEKISGIGTNESHKGTTSKMINVKCGFGSIKVDMEG